MKKGDDVNVVILGPTASGKSDLAMAEEDLGQNIPPQIQGDAKKDYLVAYLTDLILVAKAAEAKKVQDTKEFKARLTYNRNKLLMEQILQSEAKAAVTPDATKKVYDDAVKQMSDEQEVRARHILVPSEDEAKAILAELKKGTDFAELAKQKSKDPGAAAEGGDLGYFTKEQMVPEFADVAFKLDKGQLSDPVKSQFGWHIIKVEDKRKKPAPDFAQVKDQVETYVQRKAQADFITKLREGAKVVVNGRDEAKGQQAVAEMGGGPNVVFYGGDASKQATAEGIVDFAIQKFGKLDIMCLNSGGVQNTAPVHMMTNEEWALEMDWNLNSVFWGMRKALNHMIPRQSGRIIVTSSVEGKLGKPGIPGYAATKHAVLGLMKAAAKEVGTLGITVNAILPGLIETDIVRETGPESAKMMGVETYEGLLEMFAQESAIKRLNTVEEVAAAAVMLASDAASGITGTSWAVDGGTLPY